MSYKEIRPPEKLEHIVKCFWYINKNYSKSGDGEVVWPDGCFEIIFHFDTNYEVDDVPLDTAFLIGSLTHYHTLKANGHIKLFGIRLKPWGLSLLTKSNIKNLKDKFIPLSDIFNNNTVENTANDLMDLEFEEGVKILVKFLLKLCKQQQPKDYHFISYLSELYENPTALDLNAHYERSNYSQRQFERKTIELTGISPKKLSKVARFNQVRLKIFREPTIDLYECMQEYGYYDYAHFSKEFKESIGLTPNEYKNFMLDKIKSFKENEKDVVFLQEEPSVKRL